VRILNGFGLVSFIFFMLIVVFLVIYGIRIGAPFFQNTRVERIFEKMARDSSVRKLDSKKFHEIFRKEADLDNTSLRSIEFENIEIKEEGSSYVINATYSVKVPFYSNISICIDFNPSSKNFESGKYVYTFGR